MLFQLPIIAIDVGRSSIKVVELMGDQRKKLKSIGVEVIPDGAVVDSMIRDPGQVEASLRQILRRMGIQPSRRRAAIGLGGSSLLLRRANFTLVAEEADMHEQIYYEAEQHFQYDMDELYFDYVCLSNRPSSDGTVPFLLVGAKRSTIDPYLSIIRTIGMRTGVVDCQVLALLNVVEHAYGSLEGLIAVANLGASSCQIVLSSGGEYLYSRDVSIGGELLTEKIMERLSVDRMSAETLKLAATSGDGEASGAIRDAVDDIAGQMISEIQMTVDYYTQNYRVPESHHQLSQIFLAGGGARTFGLLDAVADGTGTAVEILNPFQNIEIRPGRFHLDQLEGQSSLFSVAMGLAMRSSGDASP